jgi:hypothetical protein
MQHEPSRPLAYAQGAINLAGGNSVLGIRNHPNQYEPFGQVNGRVLENRSYAYAELPAARRIPALEKPTTLDLSDILRPAVDAVRPTQPADRFHKIIASILVFKKTDGFR